MEVTRRHALIGGGLLTALALAGCGTSNGGAKSSGSAPSGKPRRGGELRIPSAAEPIAPAFDMGTSAVKSVGTAGIATLAYNGLVDYRDGKIVPELATSWTAASPTRYVLDLRKNVVFQDGTPFDAAAVKANFDRLLDPKGAGANIPPFLTSVDVLSSHQVAMNLSAPSAAFLASLRRGRVMMMSPTAVAKYAKSDPFKASVGTGPYTFTEYKSGQYVKLKRNENYWADDNYLDAITITIIPDPNTQVQAFLNGDFDVMGLVPAQVEQVRRRQGVTIHADLGNTFDYLSFNLARPPFDNADVRRGFSAAINRAGIAKGVYQGYAVPASGPFNQKIGAAWADLSKLTEQSFSIDAAKSFLTKANYDFGKSVPFSAFTQAPWAVEADALTAQLQDVGIKVGLSKEDFGSWVQRVYTAKNFTIMNSAQTTRTVDPDEIIYPLMHSKGDLNASAINDPALDKLLDQARGEANSDTRSGMYREIAELVAKNAYAAFTVYPQSLNATAPNVGGFEASEGGTNSVARCWLAS